MNAFMSCRGNMTYPVKMCYLKKFISGEALAAIEYCFYVPNKAMYELAWSILENRFGNSSLVTSALREKIE